MAPSGLRYNLILCLFVRGSFTTIPHFDINSTNSSSVISLGSLLMYTLRLCSSFTSNQAEKKNWHSLNQSINQSKPWLPAIKLQHLHGGSVAFFTTFALSSALKASFTSPFFAFLGSRFACCCNRCKSNWISSSSSSSEIGLECFSVRFKLDEPGTEEDAAEAEGSNGIPYDAWYMAMKSESIYKTESHMTKSKKYESINQSIDRSTNPSLQRTELNWNFSEIFPRILSETRLFERYPTRTRSHPAGRCKFLRHPPVTTRRRNCCCWLPLLLSVFPLLRIAAEIPVLDPWQRNLQIPVIQTHCVTLS